MRVVSSTFKLAVAACCGAALSGIAAHSPNSLGEVERAAQVIGSNVRAEDRNVGEVRNLVVDLETGRILYALVSVDGRTVAVPTGILTKTGSRVVVDADVAKLRNAPRVSDDARSELASAAFVNDVYTHFGQDQWWRGDRPAGEGSFNNTHRATDLRGVVVRNVMDTEVGKINDVAVSLPAGRVAYVLLNPDRSLELGNNVYALPPSAVTLKRTDGKISFTSDVTKEKLGNAPRLSGDNWSRLSDQSFASSVYQHYGKRAWFDAEGLQPTGRDSQVVPNPDYERSDVDNRTPRERQRDIRNRNDDRSSPSDRWNRSRGSQQDQRRDRISSDRPASQGQQGSDYER